VAVGFLRRSVSRGSIHRTSQARALSTRVSEIHPMPSRTIQESHRPRVSNRTMRCHSSSGQPSGLLFQKTTGAVTTAKWNHRGRGSVSPLRTRRRKQGTRPEEDLSQMESTRSNSWAECRDKWDRHRAEGGDFSLDIPFYRTSPVSRLDRHRGSGCPLTPATPPCVRVRTRRFEMVTLARILQIREPERFEIGRGKRDG
jgi:hypothetical protein